MKRKTNIPVSVYFSAEVKICEGLQPLAWFDVAHPNRGEEAKNTCPIT